MLILLTLLVLGVVAAKLVNRIAILLVEVIATAMTVWLYLQSDKLSRRLLATRPAGASSDVDAAWKSNRAARRLMARHLRHALRLTELSSLFPRSCARGCTIAQIAMKRAA